MNITSEPPIALFSSNSKYLEHFIKEKKNKNKTQQMKTTAYIARR